MCFSTFLGVQKPRVSSCSCFTWFHSFQGVQCEKAKRDCSPIVTAAGRGQGTLILFHVTAGPDWSDLPFSATYAQMLRRAIAAGRGEVAEDGEGSFVPQLVLDGYGRLQSPGSTAEPLLAEDFATVQPGPTHPPGFYRGPSGTRAINAAAGARLSEISAWPAGTRLLGDAEARRLDLTGLLLTGALSLLAIDLLVALMLSGRMPQFRKAAAAYRGARVCHAIGALHRLALPVLL